MITINFDSPILAIACIVTIIAIGIYFFTEHTKSKRDNV